MAKSPIHPYAFMIHEALVRLGLPSDGCTIADHVLRLEKGLAAEDEASLLFCWLGRCKLIHKLDQLIAPPTSRNDFLVPDLFAVFEYKGKEIPVLIEVKMCSKQSLSWRPDYYNRLLRYSELIGLPLLVACKWKKSPLRWTLTDIHCFQKTVTNYKLTNEAAVIFNLMFAFAGNFSLIFKEGITWHTRLKRIAPSKPAPGKRTYSMIARFEGDGFYTDGSGTRLEEPNKLLWPFFMGQPEPFTENGGIIDLRFVNPKDTFESADKVFEKLISPGKTSPYWRELLRSYGIPPGCTDDKENCS